MIRKSKETAASRKLKADVQDAEEKERARERRERAAEKRYVDRSAAADDLAATETYVSPSSLAAEPKGFWRRLFERITSP